MGASPKDEVRARIDSLVPSAAIGHRGTGPTRPGHPFPENSISSFIAAIDQGADGVELDVAMTADGKLIVMHDGTLDRTTSCAGCVSERSFAAVRACRLVDGDGVPTQEAPPSLIEVYDAMGSDALINVELKVRASHRSTTTAETEALVTAVLSEVSAAGGQNRTIFSSFDELAVELIKTRRPDYYCALISEDPTDTLVETAVRLRQDAIHPILTVSEETVHRARQQGLQVGIWTANTPTSMRDAIDKGATAILTDHCALLLGMLGR